MASTKVCRVCKVEKPLSEFGRKKQRKDGLNCDCKRCNADRVKAYMTARGAEYKAHKTAYDRARYEANKDKILAQCADWYARNRERAAESAGAWKRRNPEKRRLISQHYKHRRRAVEREGVSYSELEAWKKAAKKVCYWCGKACARGYVIDHYQPLAKGGKHELRNLVIACRSCNARKSARDPLVFAREIGRLL